MIEKLAKQIFKRKHRSKLKSDTPSTKFVDYQHAQSVLIVFESNYSEKNPEIKRIAESLIADGKSVIVWGYVQKKQTMPSELLNYKMFCKSDFDIFQRPKVGLINQLNLLNVDLLIDLNTRSFLEVDYLIMNATARFKCGVRKNQHQLFDFTLDLTGQYPEDTKQEHENDYLNIYNQLIFYLKNIQSKDY